MPQSKIASVKKILEALNTPKAQQAKICCLTLLALANLKNRSKWSSATNSWIRIHDIIEFLNQYHGTTYAENSRETFRKQALHHFRSAAFIEDNGMATNSPNYKYRLTQEMLDLLKSYNTPQWQTKLSQFQKSHVSLMQLYYTKRHLKRIPIKINGRMLSFSSGKHNELLKAIIENFAPTFAKGSQCLYIGDTQNKNLVKDNNKLEAIGFTLSCHDKLPDVILFSEENNWIYFIEAVTSVGPMDNKRINELKLLLRDVTASKIYITAFLDFKTFKRFSDKIAWETEIWLAEQPDHMIHFNGDRFLGPRD